MKSVLLINCSNNYPFSDIHGGEDGGLPGQHLRARQAPRDAGHHEPSGGGRQLLHRGRRPLAPPSSRPGRHFKSFHTIHSEIKRGRVF